MIVWILILTLLIVLMFIVLVILGITILKHIKAIEEMTKEICARTAFIHGIVEAIADMIRESRNKVCDDKITKDEVSVYNAHPEYLEKAQKTIVEELYYKS